MMTHGFFVVPFHNEYVGLMQEIYRYGDDGKITHVNGNLNRTSNLR